MYEHMHVHVGAGTCVYSVVSAWGPGDNFGYIPLVPYSFLPNYVYVQVSGYTCCRASLFNWGHMSNILHIRIHYIHSIINENNKKVTVNLS